VSTHDRIFNSVYAAMGIALIYLEQYFAAAMVLAYFCISNGVALLRAVNPKEEFIKGAIMGSMVNVPPEVLQGLKEALESARKRDNQPPH
jgi:hypothetical protein